MLALKKIAVTGGIASGKTTVCRLLEKHGAYRVSADEIIHQLLKTNTKCKREILILLGFDILTNGEIDRQKVASHVFHKPKLLQALENVLHPLLFDVIEKRYQKVKYNKCYTCFVVELPLVQEVGKERAFDFILAINADENLCIQRFCALGFEMDDYINRMKRQWHASEKSKKAHASIWNNGDLKQLERQVEKFYLHKLKPYLD